MAQSEKTIVYGDFAGLLGADGKWEAGSFPLPDGGRLRLAEPNAVTVVQNGRLRVTVRPLTRSHDHVQILDNAKHHLWSRELFTPPEKGRISFELQMRAEVVGVAPGDVYDGFVSFHLLDFSLGTAFNFFVGNEKAVTVFGRLPFPGVPAPPEDVNREYCIFEELDLPRPGDWHRYRIEYDRSADSLRWLLGGQEVRSRSNVPRINSLRLALGIMTEKDVRGGKSVSVHGQGVLGEWSAVTVTEQAE